MNWGGGAQFNSQHYFWKSYVILLMAILPFPLEKEIRIFSIYFVFYLSSKDRVLPLQGCIDIFNHLLARDTEKATVPLQFSCLENPMGGGAWWAAVHGVTKSRTRLSDFTFTFYFHASRRTWQPIPVFLPGESQGRQSLVGCHLWGRTESDTTEAT